jgi:hypothetical protein
MIALAWRIEELAPARSATGSRARRQSITILRASSSRLVRHAESHAASDVKAEGRLAMLLGMERSLCAI